MTIHQAQVPGLVEEYFGAEATRTEHPIIVQAFYPEGGWRRYGFKKRVTVAWLRR